MKFCTNCGNQLADGQKFCTKCGSPVRSVTPEPVVEVAPTVQPEPVVEAPVVEAPPVAEAPVIVDAPVVEAPKPQLPDYPNALQIILKLGKAGAVADVLDQPDGLTGPALSAWSLDQLAAITHKWGGAEFKIVFADANLDVNSYSSLASNGAGTSSARYGNWLVYVVPSTGQANESAAVLEKVFELLG